MADEVEAADPSATGARAALAFLSSPDAVFAVVADGWRYADWVVGARRVRAVDESWPEPGSHFHHEVGVGPFTVRDLTELEAIDPPHRIVLVVKVRPGGMGRVTISIEARDGGSEVLMEEVLISGPALVLDSWLFRKVTMLRNQESLKRLRRLVDGASTSRS